MAGSDGIRDGMQVIGSDGGMVGRVIGITDDDDIHVEPTAPSPGAAEHVVPEKWIARVDDHVHLDREAALVRDTWTLGEPGTAVPAAMAKEGGGKSWIFWLIAGVALLAIVLVRLFG